MPLPDERLREAVHARCTTDEWQSCVVYVAGVPCVRGASLRFPGLTLECPWDGYLAFVDLDPTANWGHRCRYVCLSEDAADATSVDAQFPPFSATRDHHVPYDWRVLYRAPGVPDAAVAVGPT